MSLTPNERATLLASRIAALNYEAYRQDLKGGQFLRQLRIARDEGLLDGLLLQIDHPECRKDSPSAPEQRRFCVGV